MIDDLPTLPVGPLDHLAKAALAPPETARAAWATWRRSYALDETPWNEVRLLGAVAPRIGWLEPEADILPRMRGIQKFLYAQTQLCLTGCMGGMRALADAGIPMLVFKGAARVISDGRAARERLVRDLDILVPLNRKREAFKVLQAAGWDYKVDGAWQKFWRRMDDTANHHAWSLSKGEAEIDLHHFSNSLNRLMGDDDGLWKRSSHVEWRGLPLLVPSPTDNLILSIVHGLKWSRECNADWLVDICRTLDAEPINWSVVYAEAVKRRLEAILFTGLRYVRDSLQRRIPKDIMDALEARSTPLQWEELNLYAKLPMPHTPAQNELFLAMARKRCGPPPVGAYCAKAGPLGIVTDDLPQFFCLDIRSLAPASEIAQVEIKVTSHESPDCELTGTLCVMGIILDSQKGVPRGGVKESVVHHFRFTVPRRLLARRGVDGLCLTIGTAANPVYPPWRRRTPTPTRSQDSVNSIAS